MEVELQEEVEELLRRSRLREFAAIQDRIRAVIHASLGSSAGEIAEQLERDIRWVQSWVYRYRDEGFDGLWDRKRSGTPPKFPPEEIPALAARILAGPKPEDEVMVFTAKNIQKIIAREFNVECGLTTVYDLLHRWGFSSLLPRPRHEKNDPELMEAWLREAPRIVRQLKKNTRRKHCRSGSSTRCVSA
ncbi:MAG: winged helix-turn-helix domain-containing protein [Rectinemataceae bacterium]|nr:winged helix-turn-helix domain-containing protein [Rectinemataceae bacterium]